MSKGSGRRPTNEKAYGAGWERVFTGGDAQGHDTVRCEHDWVWEEEQAYAGFWRCLRCGKDQDAQ